MVRCPDCGESRAWSADSCPHCGSGRDTNEEAGSKGLGLMTAATGVSLLLMSWPDRLLLLALVLTLGTTGMRFSHGTAWSVWVVHGLMVGGTLGIVLWAMRALLALVIGVRWSWVVLLAALFFGVLNLGPLYVARLELVLAQ